MKEEFNEIKTEADATNIKEFDEEELSRVAGGMDIMITKMECSSCGKIKYWQGYFVGEVFDCPDCKNHTFKGIELMPID